MVSNRRHKKKFIGAVSQNSIVTYQLPPLSGFRTFEAAARHLSFKKAAEELHVTPSAVSQQIRHLEFYLGVPLFERHPNALQLTEDGLSLVQSVREGLECFAAGVESTRHEKHCSLNVVAPHAFAARWLVPRLNRFSEHYPDVTIRVTSDPSTIDGVPGAAEPSKTEADARQETGEVAIRFGLGQYPNYQVEKLLTPDYVPVCSRGLSEGTPPLRRLEDLSHHVLLHDESIPIVEKRPSWCKWLKRAGIRGVDTERGPRFSNSVLVHEAVLEGQGIALVIKQHIETEVAEGRLVMPFSMALPSSYSYFLVTQKTETRKPIVLAFTQWISAEMTSPFIRRH